MSEPFLAEIKLVGFNFPPRGWATCDGQILPINQNQSLFSLVGTTYGGDGRTSFGLPDFRGRVSMHVGTGHNLGQKAGVETVPISEAQMPSHTHGFNPDIKLSGQEGTSNNPEGRVWAQVEDENAYSSSSNVEMATDAINTTAASVGAGQGHGNLMPYLVINYIIAIQGLFPPRN